MQRAVGGLQIGSHTEILPLWRPYDQGIALVMARNDERLFSLLKMMRKPSSHNFCWQAYPPPASKKAKPLNVVVLFTDDQRFNTIHAWGNEEIHTPNMDRLAAMGVSFYP